MTGGGANGAADRIERTACARAGLLGNPFDGYGGKALALALPDFRARVALEPADRLEIVPADSDLLAFDRFDVACELLARRGFEAGPRLLRATLVAFADRFPDTLDLPEDDPRQRFRVRYSTDIPVQVGLSGSSAIIIAALRALTSWFGVDLSRAQLAELALAVEVDYLGLPGGAMDRVIQAYEGVVLMDLQEPRTDDSYEPLDPRLLPPLFIAWLADGGVPSGHAHGDLKRRWDRGDPELRRLVQTFRALVDEGVEALHGNDHQAFRACMKRNFELRTSCYPVADADREMVAIAAAHGAVAKQCGSGGAVVGSPADIAQLAEIEAAFRERGFRWARVDPRDRSGC